jgi:hypothetical protein
MKHLPTLAPHPTHIHSFIHFYRQLYRSVCLVVGALAWWSTGFAFAFGKAGGHSNQFIGYRQFFLSETEAAQLAFYFFEFTFAATSGTVVRFVCLFGIDSSANARNCVFLGDVVVDG